MHSARSTQPSGRPPPRDGCASLNSTPRFPNGKPSSRRSWTRRPSAEAPEGLWPRIEAALGQPPAAVDLTARLQSRVTRWRATAGGAGALAAGLAAALAFVVVSRPTAPHQFVAVLQKSADAPAFAMTVDIDKLSFTVRPVAAEAPAGKSYELWLIAPKTAPKSLGLIDAGAVTPGRAMTSDPAQVREATYAVTVEPHGGSPSGQPTSAPVFFGKLVPVGP